MRLCVPIPCFFGGMDLDVAVRRAHALGYRAVESYNWRGLDLDRVRGVCEELSVEFVSLCTTEFRMTTPEHRELWLQGLRESCAAAKQAGVTRLITQVGQDTGEEREYQRAAIVETLRQAIPILETYSVTIMPEPLNPLVDHMGYYLTSAGEAFDIIREVDHPLVKIVYDIYHQQITEGNIIPSVVNNLDCIAHLHSAGHPGRIELQYGESDYKNIFAAIDKAGYTGACGLEYRPVLEPEESLRQAMELYGK